jgi:excisionase family DNA binding protein
MSLGAKHTSRETADSRIVSAVFVRPDDPERDAWHSEVVVVNAPTSLVTPREAAARLDVSDGTIRRWLAEGRIEGVRVGGRLRVAADELERFVQPAGPTGGGR